MPRHRRLTQRSKRRRSATAGTTRRPQKTPRYTGIEYIPPRALKKYPNWVLALDEEGVEGQDETTIRPADVQDEIDTEVGVCLTAADAVFVDGSRAVALVGGDWSWDGTVENMNEVRILEPRSQLIIDCFAGTCRRRFNARFFAEKADLLPVRIETRLARAKNGKKLRFRIDKKGNVIEEK